MAGTGGVRIGVVSDTHGHVPASLHDALAGVEHILHAGDVCGQDVLDELALIAPVTAARGNCDTDGTVALLPEVVNVRLGGVRFLVGHQKSVLLGRVDPVAAGVAVVITGHSHKAHVERVGDVLFLNPGSAGQGRFGGGLSCAIVTVADQHAEARIIGL